MDLLDILTFQGMATNKMVKSVTDYCYHCPTWTARNVLRKPLSRMGQNHILINCTF